MTTRIQQLEHDAWPDQTIDWFDHDRCWTCDRIIHAGLPDPLYVNVETYRASVLALPVERQQQIARHSCRFKEPVPGIDTPLDQRPY
jgi:hypothetical protein